MGLKLQKIFLPFALTCLAICLSHGKQTLFVKPANDFPACSEPCLTLNDYNQQGNRYFSSLTTFIFLEGYHHLNIDFMLTGLENISLSAPPNVNVTIDCGGLSGLAFNSIIGLTIENIAFLSCGISSVTNYHPGISLRNVQHSRLSNITILKGMAGALYIEDSTIESTNLLIQNNKLQINGSMSLNLGIMLVHSSVLNLHGKNTFVQNNGLPPGKTEPVCGDVLGTNINTRVVFLSINTTIFCDGLLIAVDNVSPSGIMRFDRSMFVMNGVSQLNNNKVCLNGAFNLVNTNARLTGEVVFSDNSGSMNYSPGISPLAGLRLFESMLEVTGSISFSRNLADISCIESFHSSIFITGTLLSTRNNRQSIYSAIVLRDKSSMSIKGTAVFASNFGYDSIIRIEVSTFSTNANVTFFNNTGAAPCTCRSRSMYSFRNKTNFENNTGIFYVIDSTVLIEGHSSFIRNNIIDLYNDGGITILSSMLHIRGEFLFRGNKVRRVDGGVIVGQSSTVTLQGIGKFIDNSARLGGVINLQQNPLLIIEPETSLVFEQNSAEQGAAIYVSGLLQDILCDEGPENKTVLCFIDASENYTLTFTNNTATNGGSLLHIDILETIDVLNITTGKDVLDIFTSSQQNDNSEPLIASEPFRLCFCDDGIPVCNLENVTRNVTRGQRLSVEVSAVSLFDNSVPRQVRSFFTAQDLTPGGVSKSLDGDFQRTSYGCSHLEYRVFSTEEKEEIVIAADENCNGQFNNLHCLTLDVTLEDCPKGFALSIDRCVCDKRIVEYTSSCDVDTNAILKGESNIWIGAHHNKYNYTYLGVILYTNCPFDYCIPPPIAVMFSDPNTQCDNNRSGILCGACKGNLSLVLGSSKCMECFDNSFIALLIPIALLGVLLVGLLFLIQLTVASGTINGLIFYANIVSSNEAVFQLQNVRVITVFIDWLNLDFGIQTCFYDGLNQLAYTGWQFAFPLYLWILVAAVIIVCHFSIRASKFFANSDPVAVLATIILLSYNKLLQNIITIFSFANLEYPPNSTDVTNTVWLYDGNVNLAQGSHAILIAVALIVLVFLFLPYTFSLLLAQFLQKSRHISTIFNRLNLTPFINTYQAPYKPASRCWIGFCLLLRCILLLVFANSENESGNLLAIITTSIVMVSIIGVAGGIYSNRWLDALEISFILNLGVFSAATYHVKLVGGSQTSAAYVSISIAFVTFLGLAVILVYQRLNKLLRFNEKIRMRIKRSSLKVDLLSTEDKELKEVRINHATSQEVILTKQDRLIELRESLLDDS